jgi:hypothetical protein
MSSALGTSRIRRGGPPPASAWPAPDDADLPGSARDDDRGRSAGEPRGASPLSSRLSPPAPRRANRPQEAGPTSSPRPPPDRRFSRSPLSPRPSPRRPPPLRPSPPSRPDRALRPPGEGRARPSARLDGGLRPPLPPEEGAPFDRWAFPPRELRSSAIRVEPIAAPHHPRPAGPPTAAAPRGPSSTRATSHAHTRGQLIEDGVAHHERVALEVLDRPQRRVVSLLG